MAYREIIISGYVGSRDPNADVAPFLQHLLGQFVDELSEADKLLYEYTAVAMMPDFWVAVWDAEKLELSMPGSGGPDQEVVLRVPNPPKKGPKVLLPALYLLAKLHEDEC